MWAVTRRSRQLEDALWWACLWGDLEVVSRCIVEDRDRGLNVDWETLLRTAYNCNKDNIVRCIRESGRVSEDTQLYYACQMGDLEFVSCCIAEEKYKGQDVNWARLMSTAYDNMHTDIVQCIRDSGRVSVYDQLHIACQKSDLEFVSQCIAEDRDREQNVDWWTLMKTANDNSNIDIVQCIRDSRRESVDILYYSCLLGDLEFVSQCIAEDKYRGQNVDWERLMSTAYDNMHTDIVRCIRDSGRVSVYDQLHIACQKRDLEFVSQCIAEDRDRGQNVDWWTLMKTAYDSKHNDIVRCIRDSGRVSVYTQLVYSCLLGDLQFVSRCIAKDRDAGQDVDWEWLMGIAYLKTYNDIVRCIRDSGRVSVRKQVYYSGLLGDLEFLSQCIADGRDTDQNVDWKKLILLAYNKYYDDIVFCIRDSGRVSVHTQVYYSCLLGDLEFVSQHIVEDTAVDHDWEKMIETAYDNKHMDIVRCIRDSRRVSLDTQLYYSCRMGDLEFVSQCLIEDRDREQCVDWQILIERAYLKRYNNIVRCIRDNGWVSVDTQLYYSCMLGDLEFLSRCIAEDRDRKQNVDWKRVMNTLFDKKHIEMVRRIKDSGRGPVDTQLYYSCLLGDLEFVSQCIAEDRDKGHNVEWERLMERAYDKKHIDIVYCIRDSGRVSLDTQLYYSCLLGDLEFVSQCIAEDRDREQNVEWGRLMERAYDSKHMDIVSSIKDSGRGSLDTQLYGSCLLGDLEFVSQCIAEGKDRGQKVGWKRLIKTANDNSNIDIVRCIRDSGRESVDTQLYYSCLLGDLEFVSQCIAENRDRGQNVDWERLIKTARDNSNMDIVHCINKSGRGSVYDQLKYVCQIGDLDHLSQFIAEGVIVKRRTWKRLMKTAYDNKHMDIVRCIRDSRLASVNTQLHFSCLLGDLEFVSQCIAEDRYRGQNVDWTGLMKIAFDKKFVDLVLCIRDSRLGSVDTQLYYSCMLGDLEFVSQCIAENRDRGQNVDWERLMKTAIENNYLDIVRCIKDTGKIPVDAQLYGSALSGDLKFVSQCIAENRKGLQIVDWKRLMNTAYENKHIDIVLCIRDTVPVPVDTQLYGSCMLGDLEFVSQCIAEDRDKGQNVDWEGLMQTAFFNKHLDIVRCIRDSGRESVDTQLYYCCLLGDLEFVSQFIAEDRDRGQNVDWERLIKAANDNGHVDIVRCIDSARVNIIVYDAQKSVHGQLYYACQKGNLEFVSQCIADGRDRGQNVDWWSLMKTAYDNKHKDIVYCIRDNGRGSIDAQLQYSCLLGDLEFVSKCIADDRDRAQNCDWEWLMGIAYSNSCNDIVRCIRDSGRGSVHKQLYYSCQLGDLEFVSHCTAEDRDKGQNVDWDRLMETAYRKQYHTIVRCIRDCGRVSVYTQVYYSCLLGDLEFVSQCIAEYRDRGHHVDWEQMMETAYDSKHIDIVRCIRDSGRGSLDTQLYYSCLMADIKFVTQCIAEGRDRGHNVDWERLIHTAYSKCYNTIVRCVRDNGRVCLYTQLYYSCVLGDKTFVSQRIAEDRDREKNVNWEGLIQTAYDNKHMDIVRCIRDNGRGSVYTQLYYSCLLGDLGIVSQFIDEDRDRGQDVDWERLMRTAYDYMHMDIVRCIRDSGRESIYTQMYYSCLLGDQEFLSHRIAEDRGRGQNVDWERLIDKAYSKKHMDVVRFIRGSGQVSVNTQLYYSCLLGDLEFVSHCIADDRDKGRNVNWERVTKTAYDNKHTNIVRCIRDNGRVSVDTQLYYCCLLGDLEFVSQCIDEGKYRGQKVDWQRLMKISYDYNNKTIVRCIRNNGLVGSQTQLDYSCRMGDLEFLSQYIAEDRDRGKNVDWKALIKTAYDYDNKNIVCNIRDSERVAIHTQLYYSCLLGDVEFVSQCIAENRDRGQTVGWGRLVQTGYDQSDCTAKVIVENGKCTLADMSYDKNIERVKFVIKHTDDVNKEIRPGLNTLHVSVHLSMSQWHTYGNTASDIINLVMKKGADVNGKGYMGRTALHFLCHGLNTDVDNIIQYGTEPYEATHQPTKKSNLHVGGQIRGELVLNLIKNVIKEGGNLNAKDENGQTPLHLLCLSEGDIGIGTLLLEMGANINERDNDGRTPLAVAAQHGNAKFISFLIKMGCDKNMGNFVGGTPLYLSAVANTLDSAEILCTEGVNVNQADDYNVTPLAAACKNNNHQLLNLLLQYEADPGLADIEERTPLHNTAIYGSVESCLRLMRTSIDLNAQDITGFTALHLATLHNHLEIIKVLFDNECDIHIASNLGNTALHNAVSTHDKHNISKGNPIIVEILLQRGSDIDHANVYGHTPIMLSANTLDFTMMEFLYAKKANLGLVNNMQRGLIHIIVKSYSEICLQHDEKYKKCQAIIKWLMEKGLSINASDVNKQTPLHLAAQQGELKLVSLLVECGSDLNARDKFKHMPLMNALEHPDVFQYLWRDTLPAVTDDDFCKLQRLSYWLDISKEVKKQIMEHAPIVMELSDMPQNVSPLKFRCNDQLEKWLRTEKEFSEELPQFMANWLPSLQSLTYIDHPRIKKVMWKFLNDLQKGVEMKDPFVAYEITPCGSVEEKTKAFAQDENDCSCVLKNIRFEMFETPTEADHPIWKAFVHLICKEQYFDHLKRVLDGKKRLSQGKLCHHFGKAIGDVLANPAFWAKYPQLQRISAKDISAGDRRICTMHVIWSDDICPWLKIDIDLAPVIDLSKWNPPWCNKHDLLSEIESIALPKWKMSPKVNMDLMEIGVHSWGPLFHKMPEEMRQGYRLAKVVRGSAICPQIPQLPGGDFAPEAQFLNLPNAGLNQNEYVEWSNAAEFINTYLLKQVIMHEYAAWYDQKIEGLDPPVNTDVYWARLIYEKMEEAFKLRELYSWFIPTYNLLTDEKFVQFQDIAVLYARLCRRLLTKQAADHFKKAYLGGS